MITNDRFPAVLEQDYDLFKLAVPHHDELQGELARHVQLFTQAHPELSVIKIYEIGCGTGETTRRILEADPRTEVVAVDNDPRMLAAARRNLFAWRGRVQFKSNAMNILGIGGKPKYDIVASAYTFHNFKPSYRSTLTARCIGALKKGGMFINADKYTCHDIVEHWQTLRDQIDAFAVFDEIERRDLRVEWTRRYLEDDRWRYTERQEASYFKSYDFSVSVPYRKGMDIVFIATK